MFGNIDGVIAELAKVKDALNENTKAVKALDEKILRLNRTLETTNVRLSTQ
jgi:hypothetical protein